jgi:presenilin-like A22 family membrane protease
MKFRLSSYLSGALVMAITFALGLFIATHQKVFVEEQGISSPNVSATPAIAYFLGVVAVVVLVLFLIPVRKLQYVFRVLFTVMYGWGVLILLLLIFPSLNEFVVCGIALACGLIWLFWTRIWFQNVLLIITLSAMGSVFGFFFASPWAFLAVMFAISIYDFLAVKFGLMVWMADKLSETTSLPAFVFPKNPTDWVNSTQSISVNKLSEKTSTEREYSILGGGDIAFPLMLAVSIYFQKNMFNAIVIAVFALLGLMTAYIIQARWLKGRPMPALPPITALSFIGFLLTQFVIK